MVKVSDGQLAHFSSIVYAGDEPSGRTSGFYEFDEFSNEDTGIGVRVYTTFDTRKGNDGPNEAASVFAWRGTDTSCGFQMAKAQMKYTTVRRAILRTAGERILEVTCVVV